MSATADDKTKLLQEQVTALLADKEALTAKEATYQQQIETIQLDSMLATHLPKEFGGFKTPSLLRELKADITFEKVDGNYVAKRNGEVVKDPKTKQPMPIDGVVTAYKEERGWKEVQAAAAGGRGGQQKPVNSPANEKSLKTRSEAEAYWKEQNPDKSAVSAEYMAWYSEIAKNDGFNLYE